MVILEVSVFYHDRVMEKQGPDSGLLVTREIDKIYFDPLSSPF